MSSRVSGVLLLVVVGALLAGCGSGSGHTTGTSAGTHPAAASTVLPPCPAQPGRPATGTTTLPHLTLSCPGGGRLDLADAPGVPTLVSLWGSWCPPCREELPLLQQYAASSGGAVRVIGVISRDGKPEAESFAEDAGIHFPSAFDGQGELMAKLGINNLPYTYFLDADGAVTYTQIGPVGSLDQLRSLVSAHLGVAA